MIEGRPGLPAAEAFLQSGTELATAAMLDPPGLLIVVRSLPEKLYGADRQIRSGWPDTSGQ